MRIGGEYVSDNALTQETSEDFLRTLDANSGTFEPAPALEDQQSHFPALSRLVAGALLGTAVSTFAWLTPPSVSRVNFPASTTVAQIPLFSGIPSASSRLLDLYSVQASTDTPVEIQQPRWLEYVMARLDSLETAEAHGRPTASSIAKARREAFAMLSDRTTSPSVVPSDDMGVMFVWHQSGWDLAITIEDQETFVWAQERGGRATFSGPLAEWSPDVHQLLNLFSA
jgi:hypothetical protein